jgi:chromate reductase
MIATPEREFDADGRLTGEMPVKLLTELMGDLRAVAERR